MQSLPEQHNLYVIKESCNLLLLLWFFESFFLLQLMKLFMCLVIFLFSRLLLYVYPEGKAFSEVPPTSFPLCLIVYNWVMWLLFPWLQERFRKYLTEGQKIVMIVLDNLIYHLEPCHPEQNQIFKKCPGVSIDTGMVLST